MEPAATSTSSPPGLPAEEKRRPRLALIVIAGAVACAALYVFGDGAGSAAYQLQFNVASDVRFKEETPRTAQLIMMYPSGAIETLTDNRYVSAFIDPRSAHRFDIPHPPPSRFFFAPAPPDHLVAITGIRALAPAGRRTTQLSLEGLVPHRQVEIVERKPDSLLIKTLPGPQIPTLELRLDPPPDFSAERSSWVSRIVPGLALFGAAALLLLGVLRVCVGSRFRLGEISWTRAAQFGAVAALILAMAVVSKFNAHPDEYLHFEAAKYFSTHWLPPALDDPAIEPSFSHYGVSYLQDLDAAYILIGKFMAVAASWIASPEIAARLGNVLLFTLLTVWLIRRPPGSFASAILLISPQIWYIFSYVNGDAWALALSLVMVVQLAEQDSLLSQYLRADGWRRAFRGGLVFAALLALLLVAKRNYYLFLPFVALVACWRTFLWKAEAPALHVMKKWAVIALAAAALYVPLRAGHEAINRFDDARLRVEQAEKFAAPKFTPSEIAAGEGAQRLASRTRGVPYSDLFLKHKWAVQSFESFSGVYHWMSLSGPPEYYLAIGTLYLALLAFLLAGICRLSWRDALFAMAVLGLAVGVVLASAYQSWTADFQPQGRYLFPVIPMIAFLFHHYRESLRSRVFNLLFACLFACSVYSFVFIGLKNIPK
ncbi:MAG TPA: hypothetical protein VNP98_07205 [Chthoniobacterales bacterium]|nr:hypothetical protein [Chthoniobacterales bacterium]